MTHMKKNEYKKFARILKILSSIIAIPFIAYGLVLGIIGKAITGDTVGFGVRLIGFFLLLQGILFIVPNSQIQKNRLLINPYLTATILPSVLLLVLGLFGGWDGLKTVLILVTLFSLAPLSLICSILSLKDSWRKKFLLKWREVLQTRPLVIWPPLYFQFTSLSDQLWEVLSLDLPHYWKHLKTSLFSVT